MTTTRKSKTSINCGERFEVVYEHKTALFGLIGWREKVRETSLGNDLVIQTDKNIERIFIDGKKIKI